MGLGGKAEGNRLILGGKRGLGGVVGGGSAPLEINLTGEIRADGANSSAVLSFDYEVADDGSLNRCLVVSFICATTPTVNSVTYDGVAMTAAPGNASTQGKTFYLLAPPVGSHALVITLSASQAVIRAGAFCLKNVDQADPMSAEFSTTFSPGGFPSTSPADQAMTVATMSDGQFGLVAMRWNATGVNVTDMQSLDGATHRVGVFGTVSQSLQMSTKPYSGSGSLSITNRLIFGGSTVTLLGLMSVFNRA